VYVHTYLLSYLLKGKDKR